MPKNVKSAEVRYLCPDRAYFLSMLSREGSSGNILAKKPYCALNNRRLKFKKVQMIKTKNEGTMLTFFISSEIYEVPLLYHN